MLTRKTIIAGWGNYPKEECYLYRPEKIESLRNILLSKTSKSFISHGLGRSYGDTALNKENGLILTTKFNRFLSFDYSAKTLQCEAGVTIEDIIDTFLPRGFFLPVVPGTKYITIGGAIANDIHGKNHHKDGSIANYIIDFELMLASGKVILCSREENIDIFWATIGGLGLTGIILTATIQLVAVSTGYIKTNYIQAKNIYHAFQLFDDNQQDYEYAVAWIDLLAKGNSLGRSIMMFGDKLQEEERQITKKPLHIPKKKHINIPFYAPSNLLNRYSIYLFNQLYYYGHQNKQRIVDYDSFFFPLDTIQNWNRLYGRRGFIQYQATFPERTSLEGIVGLLEKLSSWQNSSFLAVLKNFGKENSGLLSFPMKGYTLALDLPIKNHTLFERIHQLDDIVLQHQGRVYLAKDAILLKEDFQQMYPSVDQFREVKQRIDPNHIFSSSLAKRIGIVGD